MCLIRKLFIRFAGMLLSITLLTTARPWMTSLLWDSEWSSTSCQCFFYHFFSTSPNSSRQNSSTVSFKIRVSQKVLKFIMTTAYSGGVSLLVWIQTNPRLKDANGVMISHSHNPWSNAAGSKYPVHCSLKSRVVNSRAKSTKRNYNTFWMATKIATMYNFAPHHEAAADMNTKPLACFSFSRRR